MTARHRWLLTTATIVPLAVLSAAWTVELTGLSVGTSADEPASPVVAQPAATSLPAGTVVRSEPYTAPVSVSNPFRTSAAPPFVNARAIVADAVASGIPAPALAAYQRAATVIDSADPTCNIDWELIAAIGRVESNHGRADGNTLSPQGIATPGIVGPVLDGSSHVARIADTDGGQYDGSTRWDRAVGPMQFIPSTWAIVGVDADGDGQRNPQDINDAALATAVYLCSGTDDLSTPAGQRAAVFRYNHSQSYVATVLGVAAAYHTGDFTTPLGNIAPIDFLTRNISTPTTTGESEATGPESTGSLVTAKGHGGGAKNAPHAAAHVSGTITHQPGPAQAAGQQPSVPVKAGQPSTPPTTPPTTTPTTTPTTPPSTSPTPSPTPSADPVPAWLTKLCTTQVDATWTASTDVRQQAIDACTTALSGQTEADAQAQVQALVLALPDDPYDIVGLTAVASTTPDPAPSTADTSPSTDGTASPSASPSPSAG